MSEEGSLTVVFVWLFGLIASCFIGGMIGSSVNRFGVGLLLGILGPIGWIIVLLLPRDPVPQTSSVSNASKDNKTQVIDAPETRDLSNDAYRLYLAKRYSIERNDVFEKFTCDEKLFLTLDEALIYADSLEGRDDPDEQVETVDEAIALLISAGFQFTPTRHAEDFRVTFPDGTHEWFDPDRLIALAQRQER